MDEPRETWHFPTARIGRQVLVFDSLESTNSTAARLAASGEIEDGLVIVAEHQTAGRGQYGRVWQSRPGSSLLLSVVLHPPREVCRPVILTALAAVAMAEAVYALTGAQARLKWPNDLLVHGKKICGLLIEQHAASVVVGIGLNLTQTADEFAAAGLPEAASLAMLSQRAVTHRGAGGGPRLGWTRNMAGSIAGERVAIEADWKWRLGLLGRQVKVERYDGSTETGRLHEIGFDGLELEVADGLFRVIIPEVIAHIR